MSEPRGTPETSMEEILASIRRIISEDAAPPAAPARGTRPAAPPAAPIASPAPVPPTPVPAPEPVSLSISPPPARPAPPPLDPASVLRPPPPVKPASTSPAAVWGIAGDQQASRGAELVLTQVVSEDGTVVALDRSADIAGPAPAATREPAKPQALDVLLLTDALPAASVAEAPPPNMPAALARPAPAPSPQAGSPPPPAASAARGTPSLEDLVRQSLEPKIQDWLNANLKDMVERLVQQEIERIRRRSE